MMTSPTRRRFNLAGWRKRKARRTDPPTSHAAVATVTEASLGAKRAAVLGAIEDLGRRACDHELVEYYLSQVGDNAAFPPQTPSGIRTRRNELVKSGLLADIGLRATLPTGRQAIVWSMVG